jgi:DNA invertase Pin-like site-specific DNA recombinase
LTTNHRLLYGRFMRIVGYIRVSTDEQADSGAGLGAQRTALTTECARRGFELVRIYEDAGVSGKSIKDRPGLQDALAAVETGEAEGLIVSKLDRLSRSLLDFAELMERSRRKDWALIALDLGVDTSTPSGEMMANVLAVFAQFERRLIGQRTRDALADKRSKGVVLGRRRTMKDEVVGRIKRERAAGASLQAIADGLNADATPTAQKGKRWYPSTVRAVLGRAISVVPTRT